MEPTTKYSLSGLYRNSFLVLLSFTFLNGFAQSGDNSASQKTIQHTFSMASINAYRENSLLKIADFYQYLNLLADQSATNELKIQLKENILSLYIKDVMVEDLAFDGAGKIPLLQLLDKISGSGMEFTVDNSGTVSEMHDNFWVDYYSLEIRLGEKVVKLPMTQKIYFMPERKQFGNSAKEVWEISLGEMER